MYRVRKAWNKPKTQIGAFENLLNAKLCALKAGLGYSVFDDVGKNILKNKKKEEKSKTLYIDSGITIFGLNIEICIDEKVKDNLDKYKETIK